MSNKNMAESNAGFFIGETNPNNSIIFNMADCVEKLRISPDGFYVEGRKVESDLDVHTAFVAFLRGSGVNVRKKMIEREGERYTAESLEDIAAHFDSLAKKYGDSVSQRVTEELKISAHAVSITWREAARILRSIKLKGL